MAKTTEDKQDAIAMKLGRKMHQISIQQEIVVRENKILKQFQDEANKLDKQLGEFDDG